LDGLRLDWLGLADPLGLVDEEALTDADTDVDTHGFGG
jgi:hypothetical protein